MKKIGIILLAMATLMACERRYKQDVLMLYPNWTEGVAITYLAKVILEKKGYTVDLKRLEPGPIFAALSRGDADVYMAAWLPYTHEYYWDRFGDRLEVGGVVFDNGITGLVVPAYVDINSIEELNDHKDKFEGGKIYGAPGRVSMATPSGRSKNTGWKPHQMWSIFDLKALEDPKGIYPTDEVTIFTRGGFAEDQPEVARFFHKLKLDDQLLEELIGGLTDERDPEISVLRFYDKHRDIFEPLFDEKIE